VPPWAGQIRESTRPFRSRRKEAEKRVSSWLDRSASPRQKRRARDTRISLGGYRQRAMIAMALALRAEAVDRRRAHDALDVTIQRRY